VYRPVNGLSGGLKCYRGFGPSAVDMQIVGHMINMSKAFDNKHHTFDDATNKVYKRLMSLPTGDKEEPASPFYQEAIKQLKKRFGTTYSKSYTLGRGIWLAYELKVNTQKDRVILENNKRLSDWWKMMPAKLQSGLPTYFDVAYMTNNVPVKEVPAVRFDMEECEVYDD